MSELEANFAVWLRHERIGGWVREHEFHPTRKWRFDFAWIEEKVAVEIEGGVWVSGRHQRGGGFIADCEKYEAALQLGWTVYRIPGVWVIDDDRRIWRPEVMDTLRVLLAHG